MIIEFLCGCTTGNVESRENLKTMDSIEVDAEGMLICRIHHMRRKGWRSVPKSESRPGVKHGSYLGATSTEIEGRMIFGEPIRLKVASIGTNTVKDSRDIHDPGQLGAVIQRIAAKQGLSFADAADQALWQ